MRIFTAVWPLLVFGCAGRASRAEGGTRSAPPSAVAAPDDAPIRLVSSFDLPREDSRSRELSGIAWDGAANVLFAVSDTVPVVVPLRPAPGFASWSFGKPITLVVRDAWDGEAIALTKDGFLVANERGPHIYAFDRTGKETGELPLPSFLASCVANKSLESLSLTPDGRYLFTANESTLLIDQPQPTPAEGALVRILRRDIETRHDVAYAYRTEPIFANGDGSDMGVSDVLALSATEILVMERSFVPHVGNSVRIFRATLGGVDVLNAASIPRTAPVLPKSLFLDFETLPGASIEGQGPHHLPNYEGLALGPTLPDRRRILFVISDDNANPALVARVLVLSVREKL